MLNGKMTLNKQTFEWGKRTYIMGILNITPDSFSGDGLLEAKEDGPAVLDQALAQASAFSETGTDILDIGAESTRPGAEPVPAELEIERLVPTIQAISAEMDVVISVDTYKAEVAEAALQAGAQMINDVWGFKVDPELAFVAAWHKVPVILMHNRSSWANAEIQASLGGRYVGVPYDDLITDIKFELMESVTIAQEAGVQGERIILDPGIGFGKTVEQNLELVARLGEFRALGFPILLGPSRKSFIGYTLDLPPDERLEGTAAAVAIGIANGADIIRVHDVAQMTKVARMADAITRRE
jgi:dihydropteroate synthase